MTIVRHAAHGIDADSPLAHSGDVFASHAIDRQALFPVTLIVALCSSGRMSSQSATLDLLTATVGAIQTAVQSGALTYERLVRQYLARIEADDKQGPQLHAVITINPRAVEPARALDDERRASGLRSPLHGIPVAVKDNIDTADLPTTGGTLHSPAATPGRDARVVERLRESRRHYLH